MKSSRCKMFALVLAAAAVLNGCAPTNQAQFDEEKEAHFLLGRSRVNALDYHGAIEAFNEALEANPRSAAAHFELGVLFSEREPDPAAAIHHYQQYLRLRPDAGNAEMIREQILRLKTELARTLLPVTPPEETARQMEQLAAENRRLREELERYRNLANARVTPTNSTSTIVRSVVRSDTVTLANRDGRISAGQNQQQPIRRPIRTPVPAVRRTHVVQSGDTPAAIARRYYLKLDKLMAANPGLDPRRMRVGQTLTIPTS